MFFSVFSSTTNKNLFHSVVGTRSLRIFSWDRPLWFHKSSVHLVWPCFHGCTYLLRGGGLTDKPKASGALGGWISHPHAMWERSSLLIIAPQTLAGCFKAQTSDTELPQLFWLFGRLWLWQDDCRRGDFGDAYSVASTGRKAVAVAEGFGCCQETQLSRTGARGVTGKLLVTTDLWQAQRWQGLAATKETWCR